MPAQPPSNPHPAGHTTGSPERPAQRVAAPVLGYDLAAEVALLHQESSWLHGDRNSKTLVKEPDLRVVLTALKAGAALKQHQAAGRTVIQVVSGHLRLQLPDDTVELKPGQLLALERNMPHDVEALTESAFVLTIAWPAG
ncbi:MAG TPA: cupin domain-containing protein [Chloroflexota bacterium]|jgi:quercetin dioxygenase-like cupin family protein